MTCRKTSGGGLGRRAAVLCIAILLPPAATASSIELSGFHIDTGHASSKQVAETLATLKHQIGIVEAAKLPASVLAFFRKVPVRIDPSLTGMNGQYVRMDGEWVVRARAATWPADRAILLHELLHAYHRQVLGQPTPIDRAFREARQAGFYPPDYADAHFLSRPGEYFAIVAEIYLSGPTFRPPFNCGNVQKAQPAFITYLASLFGQRACR